MNDTVLNKETKTNAPASPFLPKPKSVTLLWGGSAGWSDWTSDGGWRLAVRADGDDAGPGAEVWEKIEGASGRLRSPTFTIEGDQLRLRLAGFDVLNHASAEGACFLRLAAGGEVVQEATPPLKDAFAVREWFVRHLKGKQAYLELKGSKSFAIEGASLALSRVEEIRLHGTETEDVYYCLEAPAANAGIWGLTDIDYEGNKTARHLSSCLAGDDGVGIIQSPSFVVGSPTLRLKLRGYYQRYQVNKNRIELVDAATEDILRTVYPPNTNPPAWSETDVTDLLGRTAFIRVVDCDNGPHTAWIGVDEIDAGDAFRADFGAEDGDVPTGWQVVAEPPRYTELYGVPFVAGTDTLFAIRKPYSLPVGVAARHLLIAGMKVSERNSYSPEDKQVTVGQGLGSLRVCYADGEIGSYPIVIGESAWWGEKFVKYPEPFVSFTEVRRALQESLRIYPAQPTPTHQYVASINPKAKPIARIEYAPEPGSGLTPVVTGITVVPLQAGDRPEGGLLARSTGLSAALTESIERRPLRLADVDEEATRARIRQLQDYMYVTDDNFPQSFPLDIPIGYKGPEVRFTGGREADFFTNAFYHNVLDMAAKVDDKGVYHTSSAGALSYGYDGIGGTFSMDFKLYPNQEHPGMYYDEAWSRDIGRTLMEMIAFGFVDQAVACADWCLKMARVWEEDESLTVNGYRLPRHIHRILQFPRTEIGTGCFENDGHGLTSLFIYQLWKRLPEREAWLRPRWEDIKGLGDWIVWQFEHPEVSKATDVLWSDSEGSGYPISVGHSIFCDLPCIEALHGLAEMAASIGESESARIWEETAVRLKLASERFYIVDDEEKGQVWTDQYRGFGRGSLLGPLLLPTDTKGLFPENTYPEWYALNEKEYAVNKAQFVPWAMGYNAAFTTQASLLLDRTADASEFMKLNAKLIYGPVYRQYIVPEIGGAVNRDKKIYSRFGDLGNAVQQAEILKALKIIIGVDDSQQAELGLISRLPQGWDGVWVRDYPFLIEDGARRLTAKLEYDLRLAANGAQVRVLSSDELPAVKLRVGPFDLKHLDAAPMVLADGKRLEAAVERSGDAAWVRFNVPAGKLGFSASVQF